MKDEGHDVMVGEEVPPDHRSGLVAVIGRPNVGKSTLLNRLLGQKIAITSPKPQTTRDQLLGILTLPQAQILVMDTPGIHKPEHKLGEHMVSIAEDTIVDADVVLWLVDVNVPPTDEDAQIAAMLETLHRKGKLPGELVVGLNKVDQPGEATDPTVELRASEALALVAGVSEPGEGRRQAPVRVHVVACSGLTGAGVDDLIDQLCQLLPLGPRYYPEEQVTDLQTRFIVGELVREKALLLLQQEVPHSIAVMVDEFTARGENLTYISAVIYVERESQKSIVLGQKGSMIKKIGQTARPEIEELVGTKVYLELWVKVWEKWRRREGMLRRLGYATG